MSFVRQVYNGPTEQVKRDLKTMEILQSKGYDVRKETKVNNLEWYSSVKQFCKLSETCTQCPFHCMEEDGAEIAEKGHCFEDRDKLEALSAWLASPCERNVPEASENQWLKDLLNQQFDENDSDEDYLFEDLLR
jgi:aldehyde:ferredoxin oxidoreductase